MTGTTKSWKWHYFVEAENDQVKCTSCGKICPIRKDIQSARRHLKTDHNENSSVPSNHSSKDWQSQFTMQDNKMKCKLCGINCNIINTMSEEMKYHLEREHDINENKFIEIIENTYDKIYDQNQKEKHRCKKCGYTCPPKSNILINHLLDNHHYIPAKIRPGNLRLSISSSSSSRNVDENTAESTSHLRLETIQEMDQNKVVSLVTHIIDEIYDINENGNNCKKCQYPFLNYDFDTIIKHSMDNHESDIPAEIRPKRLPNISSSFSKNVDETTTASTRHLRESHEMIENEETKLITYLESEIYDINKDAHAIICKKCSYTFINYDDVAFKNHAMNNHESDIPIEIRPKSSSSSSTNVDEDTAASCSHW